MLQHRKKFFTSLALIALQMGLSLSASAQVLDIDPENGELLLRSSKVFPMPGYTKVQAEIRATDNFGLVRTREVQMDISGDAARGTRKVIARRYEPECLNLAALAHMSADQFCDNLTVTGGGDRLTLAFSSIDANKRYSFNLKRDIAHPNQWQALRPSTGTAPELTLTLNKLGDSVDYLWSMSGVRNARYYQHGQVAQSWLRDAGVNDLEGSLFALGDVLNSFNAWEFEAELYPRDHPAYKPTPYSNFGGEVEGGCAGLFCWGNVNNNGGGGGGGNSNQGGMCDRSSPNYVPENCPYDLTMADYPLAARFKIWKLESDDLVLFSYFLKNVGSGPLKAVITPQNVTASGMWFTLSRVGSQNTPYVPFGDLIAQTDMCYRFGNFMGRDAISSGNPSLDEISIFSSTQFLLGGIIQPQQVSTVSTLLFSKMKCSKSSGRPSGRYRMLATIDPANEWDTNSANNSGNSGPADWVNLNDR